MPLRCINHKSVNIQSFDLSDDEWMQLKFENKKSNNLKMPCCNADLVLKQSRLGTRFFAHKTKGTCLTSPETEEHQYLKHAVIISARKNSWTAQSEVTGKTPSGEEWRADILATKGKYKVAVEIQWSSQTNEETFIRQERYNQSGIRCLWLFRQPGFPIAKDLPAVCIGGDLKEGFMIFIGKKQMKSQDKKHLHRWEQHISLNKFLDAVFNQRFQFISFLEANIDMSLRGIKYKCYHCKTFNTQIAPIEFNIIFKHGYHIKKSFQHFVNLKCNSEIESMFLNKIPKKTQFGSLKIKKKTNGIGKNYLSNICSNCGMYIDEHLILNYKLIERGGYKSFPPIYQSSFKATKNWHDALEWIGWNDHWRII